MGKGTNKLEAITQQNELLKEQNDLLREQNALLQPVKPGNRSNGREIFIENIDRDEVRSNFFVTSQRKKLWNVQIGLIKEFDRICKKHDLRWFALYGTLLGAVRHKGFVPWDDDVDVVMFRPDYEKFQQIVWEEVKPPYFLDIWYNYRLESEGASLDDPEGDFQFITTNQQYNRNPDVFQMPHIKIRDSRTTMLEVPDRHFINQGIWIDIFPLDPVPPFTDEKQALIFEIAKTLLMATTSPHRLRYAMQYNQKFVLSYDELNKFLSLPYKERGKSFENFMIKNFFMSEYMRNFHNIYYFPKYKAVKAKDFADVTYLPFEKIEIPVPGNYESILTDLYGDWRTPIQTHTHAKIYSADIPWEDYLHMMGFK